MEIERVLREIAAPQHGVVTRRQLLERGISVHAIDRMVRTCRLLAVGRGVYQVGPRPSSRAAEAAAALSCGPGGRISHRSAAVLLGIQEASRIHIPVEVTMPRESRRRVAGVKVHRVRDLRPDEVTTLDGIPVTTPARTILDMAETETTRDVEQALARVLRMGLVTLQTIREIVDRHPTHRGAPVLRRLLDAEEEPAFTRSQAEERLLDIVRAGRLPRPELNALVLGHEVDLLWRSERVVAEVDGFAFHGSFRSFAEDRRRDAELAAAGYRVLRFTWSDVTDGRYATVVRLAQALMR